jgi:hypothetical protein
VIKWAVLKFGLLPAVCLSLPLGSGSQLTLNTTNAQAE